MISLRTFRARLFRILNDEDRSQPTWKDGDVVDYIDQALTAFADHTPKSRQKIQTLLAATTQLELPEDLKSLGPILIASGGRKFFGTPAPIGPGRDISTISSSAGNYYVWGDQIVFLSLLSVDDVVTLSYYGYYDRPEDENSRLDVPRWAEEAMLWYCVTLAVAKPGIKAADLGQWKTRTEAGIPKNPLIEFGEYAMRRYREIMAEHPSVDRNNWEANVG